MLNDPNFKKLYCSERHAVDINAPACGADAYYEQAFAEIDAGQRRLKWNWAASLFPAPWLMYRQMYAWFVVFILSVTALRVYFYDFTDLPYICVTGIYIVAFLAMGAFGTRIYLAHVKRRYECKQFPDSPTDIFGVIYTIVMAIIAVGFSAYLYFHNAGILKEAGQEITRATQLVPQWFNFVKLGLVLHYPVFRMIQNRTRWGSCKVK